MTALPSFALVNAFSRTAFGGNPAAVVSSADPLDDTACAALAREFALPATAFVSGDAPTLRWFNASGELALCGHGTLAAAHILREAGRMRDGETITFASSAGPLPVRAEGDLLWLSLTAAGNEPVGHGHDLATSLGDAVNSVRRGAFDLIAEFSSAEEVAKLRPDFERLILAPGRGVIATAPAEGSDADYVLRFFAPRLGIDEDAVTATAHAAVAPLWAERLGRAALTGRQLSSRGGVVRSRLTGNSVEIAGEAVTLVQGELRSGWA